MRVTGKILYAATSGTANYHRQGRIVPDVIFDHLVNDQPTGAHCVFTGQVVWEGPHAGQVAIVSSFSSESWTPGCDPACRDIYYADVDWNTGTFVCVVPDGLDYCCTQHEGKSASMQLSGTVWSPRCVTEGYFECPGSAYAETVGTVKTNDGGYLTVIRRTPAGGVHEFVLIDQDCHIVDTFISTEQADGWGFLGERPDEAGAPSDRLPGYLRDNILYVCWQRFSDQQHCWMSLEYPAAPPEEQWAQVCYTKIQTRFYELTLTPSGFQTAVYDHLSGPLEDACPVCENFGGIPGNYGVMHAAVSRPTQKGQWNISLWCLDPSKAPGYKGGYTVVQAPLGTVDCSQCQVHDITPASGSPYVYVDGVQFINYDGMWYRYSGCLWQAFDPEHNVWDFWNNHVEVKFSTNVGVPLAFGEGGLSLITTGGYKISMSDGSVIDQVDPSQFYCCYFQNTHGLLVGTDRRTTPWNLALLDNDFDYVQPCCDASDEELTGPTRDGSVPAGRDLFVKSGGKLLMHFPETDPNWQFCSSVPLVSNADRCPIYMVITFCQTEDASNECDEGEHHIKARFSLRTTPEDEPVAGATVTCKVTGAVNDIQVRTTDSNGIALFETGCFVGDGVTFEVVSASLENHVYLKSLSQCTSVQWEEQL